MHINPCHGWHQEIRSNPKWVADFKCFLGYLHAFPVFISGTARRLGCICLTPRERPSKSASLLCSFEPNGPSTYMSPFAIASENQVSHPAWIITCHQCGSRQHTRAGGLAPNGSRTGGCGGLLEQTEKVRPSGRMWQSMEGRPRWRPSQVSWRPSLLVTRSYYSNKGI